MLVIYLAHKYCLKKSRKENHSVRDQEMVTVQSESAIHSLSLIAAPSMSTHENTFFTSPWLSKGKNVPPKDSIIVLPTHFCTSTPLRNVKVECNN